MKKINFISFFLILSCSQLDSKKAHGPNSLENLLSADELKIHRCLNSEVKPDSKLLRKCLAGTQYEALTSRTPSDDTENEILLKNNWFFGDQNKLSQFYEISRGFVKASEKYLKKATNDRGIGVDGSAFFGVGAGWLAEVVNHHGKIGLFCAPYITATTDVGVAASLSVVQSISCPTNQSYEGGFLQIGAGISGELIGLPVDLGAAYSFGVDLPGFAARLKASRSAGKLRVAQLASEVRRLSQVENFRGISNNNNRNAAIMELALKPVSVLGIRTPGFSSVRRINSVVKEAIYHHKSLGIQFKRYYADFLSQYLVRNNMPMLKEFFTALVASMSGCDSVGGSAALSLTLSPVALNVQYQNYALLMEMQFEDLRALKVITPLVLLNPFLMNPEDLRATARVARSVLSIPVKVPRMCNKVFPRI